jgi:hypothetical protein
MLYHQNDTALEFPPISVDQMVNSKALVRSGRVASGEQGAHYHLTRPDTPATVVGFRKIGRDLAVSVRLEDASHGVFRYLDVSRAF